MIYVGIDDTDILDAPGTNQLARHIVRELAGQFRGRMILRHQLLEDPRVPCTRKNGCASILFEPMSDGWHALAALPREHVVSTPYADPAVRTHATLDIGKLVQSLRELVVAWSPRGSDPGLCVADSVPPAVVEWGLRCQSDLVTQSEARQLAAEYGLHLEGLGGTEDGVIGALAAVGLRANQNDGRVIYFESEGDDWYDITGCHDIGHILSRGVDEIRTLDSGDLLTAGLIDVGKRLRPNLRGGKVVLFAERGEFPHWEAVRVT